MKEWYETKIEECLREWRSLITVNPKAAIAKMEDANNYRTLLNKYT